ncbi:MAG: NAD-dependent DNA ligase LigA [Chitinophagales bacterium]|nr:NAD-dependent DNA ligase LigA [Chitinophagales bacterium]
MQNSEQEQIQQIHSLLQNINQTINESNSQIVHQQLSNAIQFLDQKYYVDAAPIVTDYQYDLLFKQLKQIEAQFPNLVHSNSPTQKVANDISSTFQTVQHLVPMLSLENSYNLEDLMEFDRRVHDALPNAFAIDYIVEPKFDGSSIALVYENDQLVRAATRGNGTEGDDITENAKTIKSIPKQVKFSQYGITKIELRGEVLLELKTLEKLNQERTLLNESLREQGKKELELYKNARNTAAGSLRLKNPQEVAERNLDAFMYQIGKIENQQGEDITQLFKTHEKSLATLQELGFKTATNHLKVFSNIQAVETFCKEWEAKRDSFPFDIDGMVIKVNDLQQQHLIGRTSHHPKWAIAFKFKAKQAISKLLKVDYQVGRTGAVTPVAKINPVQLMGVEISSISLHNEEFISSKDIQLNDMVIVERAGDVIPYIVGVDYSQRNNTQIPIVFPTHCPSCNDILIKPIEESVWRCQNVACPAQQEEHLIHFVSKGAMNIDGMGEEIIRKFLQENIITDIISIYNIDFNKVALLDGWKEKSLNNLQQSIEQSKQNELWRLIVGLGIRHVGTATAKMLATQVESLTLFKNWTIEQFTELQDVGPKVAEGLHAFFQDEHNLNLILKLKDIGININKTEIILDSNKLNGKSFLFTGSLSQFSRDEAKNLVEQNGGKNISAVSSKLDYLVAGEKAGSKLKKAEKIATIKVITEQDFLDMIK